MKEFDAATPGGDGKDKLEIDQQAKDLLMNGFGIRADIDSAVSGLSTASMLSPDDRRREIAGNGSWLSSVVVSESATGFPLITNVVWPDGSAGVLTAVEDDVWEGARKSWVVTYGSSAAKTLTQPAMTRNAEDGRVTNKPAIIIT